jgi:WD40 repeat protein
MNAFICCSRDSTNSIVIGEFERKENRTISVPNGITCFEVSKRPSFIITGGRDKIIRLWNPFILTKPAATLTGHMTAIMAIAVNNEESQFISLSDDKVIKIWNVRNLNCLQTMIDKTAHRPENIISSIFLDICNRRILTGSSNLEIWPVFDTSLTI